MKAKLLLLLLLACTTANAANTSLEGNNAETDEPSLSDSLRALLDSGYEQPAFLDVDAAFQLEINAVDAERIVTSFAVADGYYLYREKITFSGDGDIDALQTTLPPGEIKDDPYFGEMAVFKHDFSAPITIQRRNSDTTEINLHATYQGCAEDGICYSPVKKTFTLKLPALISSALADEVSAPATSSNTSARSIITILLGAFLAGLLLTFTPCVLPMLPILSSVIAARGDNITKRTGGIVALAYVLGTMLTYAAMGALAGASGEQLQAYFQNVWAVGFLAAVLVVMALSMFGLFTIQAPAWLQSNALQTKLQNKIRHMSSALPLVFVLGAFSAVVVGACVSPVLISFLGIAVSSGDASLGAQMMTAMALGMGIPLIALGLGAGHLLPKIGQWMEKVKHIFGVMLIAVAIYLLGVLPEVPVLLLWGAFLIIIGIYLATRLVIPANAATYWQAIVKGAGVIVLVWGVVALLGGFFGERDPFRPLPMRLFATIDPDAKSPEFFTHASTLVELDQQFARAIADNKLVMLDYHADWCIDCVRMKKTTFRDPRVLEVLQKNFIVVQIDVSNPRDKDSKALKKRFGVFGPPAVLFFDRNGVELKTKHFYGYRSPTEFYAVIATL